MSYARLLTQNSFRGLTRFATASVQKRVCSLLKRRCVCKYCATNDEVSAGVKRRALFDADVRVVAVERSVAGMDLPRLPGAALADFAQLALAMRGSCKLYLFSIFKLSQSSLRIG